MSANAVGPAPVAQPVGAMPAAKPQPVAMGRAETIVLGVFLVVLWVLFTYSLICFWPPQVARTEPPPPLPPAVFLFWTIGVPLEVRMFLTVIFAGAVGGCLHSLRSYYWYVGNRKLVRSWLAMYLFLPLIGASLGLGFYVIIRGGFLSGPTAAEDAKAFGFAAAAFLGGLFSAAALRKLQDVASTLFAQPEQGEDPVEKQTTPTAQPGSGTIAGEVVPGK